MKTISICIIAKDEEETIERCLKSIQNIADEIIVVDTGSQDKTREIASEFTDKVYGYTWEGNFSKARNFCQSFATKDIIFWMDCDNYFLGNDALKIQKIIQHLDFDILHLYERGVLYASSYKTRIFRRELGMQWIWNIHEIPEISYNVNLRNFYINSPILEQKSSRKNKKWDSLEYWESLIESLEDKYNSNISLQLIEKYMIEKPEKSENIATKIPIIHFYFLQKTEELIEKCPSDILKKILKRKLFISKIYWKKNNSSPFL